MTAADLLDARPRLRPDAMVGPAQQRGPARVHLVRVGERSLELGAKEHFVVARLDGTRSLGEISADYRTEFGRDLGPANWGQILGTLHRRALLAGDGPENPVPARPAPARPAPARPAPAPGPAGRTRSWGKPIPVLRRPEAMLDAVLRRTRLLLSAWVVLPLVAAVAVMELVLVTRLDVLVGQTGRVLTRPGPLLLVCLLTWVAAAFHETAHGLAARRFGVPVREIGVRWTPPAVTPYCRTDDYLHLPRRGAHVAIAAAGIVVELVLLLPVFAVWESIAAGPTRDVLGAVLLLFSIHALFNLLPVPPLDGYRMLGHALALTDYARHTVVFLVLVARRDPSARRYPGWVRACYAAYAALWVVTAAAIAGGLVLIGRALTGTWLWATLAVAAAGAGALAARMLARRRAGGPSPSAAAAPPPAPATGRHRAPGPADVPAQHGGAVRGPTRNGRHRARPPHQMETRTPMTTVQTIPPRSRRPVRPALELAGVVKRYAQVRAVDGVTLSVAPGEFLGLLGPNGAGKTTLVEIAIGLRKADAGSVAVLGAAPWPRNTAVLPRLGVQTQSAAFFLRLTAREHLRTVAGLYGLGSAAAEKALRLVGLEACGDLRAERLSGGQQQRLAIASALVHDPELVFLDEPTASLDPKARRELWGVLRALHSCGRTVVYATHHLDEAEALCDRVAILARGRVVALGAPYELIDSAALPARLTVPRHALAVEQAQALPGVLTATREGPSVVVETHQADTVHAALAELVGRSAVQVRTPTLEDVYLDLIGSEIHT